MVQLTSTVPPPTTTAALFTLIPFPAIVGTPTTSRIKRKCDTSDIEEFEKKNRRWTALMLTPQEKLLQKQVDLLEDQVAKLGWIESHLEQFVHIQSEMLLVVKGKSTSIIK